MPIWSKLKTGRIPQGEELFDILNNQLELGKSHLPKVQGQQFQYQTKDDQDTSQEKTVEEQQQQQPVASQEDDFKEFDNEVHSEL